MAIFTQILTQPGYEVYPTFLKSRGWALAREGAFDRGLMVIKEMDIFDPAVFYNFVFPVDIVCKHVGHASLINMCKIAKGVNIARV